ncbi:MAG: (Fe-S)-binding protein [Nitrospinota bacterium]
MNSNINASLSSIANELAKCTKCAACHASCPTYEISLKESLSARGKIRLAEAVLNENLTLTNRIANDFGQCLSCMTCETSCPANLQTMVIFDAMRRTIFETNRPWIARFTYKYILPYPARLNILAKITGLLVVIYNIIPNLFTPLLPFAANSMKRKLPDLLQSNLRQQLPLISKSKVEPAKGRILYFSGCMTDLAFSTIGKGVVEVLNQVGFDVIFPSQQVCCGAPPYFDGASNEAKVVAKMNLEMFAKLKFDSIVCSCATCASVLKEIYPKLLPDDELAKSISQKVFDFQQVVFEQKTATLFSKVAMGQKKIRVTYHDPCHLKRGIKLYDAPRKLLKSIPAIEFVEMESADACCGGAGTFSLNHYDMAMKQGEKKAKWINESKVDIVVTECPSCQLQLGDSINRCIGSDGPIVLSAAELLTQVSFLDDASPTNERPN